MPYRVLKLNFSIVVENLNGRDKRDKIKGTSCSIRKSRRRRHYFSFVPNAIEYECLNPTWTRVSPFCSTWA